MEHHRLCARGVPYKRGRKDVLKQNNGFLYRFFSVLWLYIGCPGQWGSRQVDDKDPLSLINYDDGTGLSINKEFNADIGRRGCISECA